MSPGHAVWPEWASGCTPSSQNNRKKICVTLCHQGLTVLLHNSPHCLVRGKIPCGLRMLGRGIQQCRIPIVIVVAYGKKTPFADLCILSSFQPPLCSLLSQFDLSRYCYVLYIPIFGKVDDVLSNIYPMLGELGGGYGSVEVNLKLPHTQSCTPKIYPKLVHYLKARNIGADLPTPNSQGVQGSCGSN